VGPSGATPEPPRDCLFWRAGKRLYRPALSGAHTYSTASATANSASHPRRRFRFSCTPCVPQWRHRQITWPMIDIDWSTLMIVCGDTPTATRNHLADCMPPSRRRHLWSPSAQTPGTAQEANVGKKRGQRDSRPGGPPGPASSPRCHSRARQRRLSIHAGKRSNTVKRRLSAA
jgi:hypothetical protein